MEIIHISAECFPAAKVGGLADVVGALPKYQAKAGHIAKVVMPATQTVFLESHTFEEVYVQQLHFGLQDFEFKIYKELGNTLGFDLYLVVLPPYTNREKVYGYDDDVERFLIFQIAALSWMAQWEHQPNLVHCHDHHAALIPFMMQYSHAFSRLKDIPTVLTIHNAQYQGQFGWDKLSLIPTFDVKHAGLLDWDSCINPLATGIKCAWAVTTVSPSYLEEMQVNAKGLQALLQQERQKCTGILNGIDNEVWNPMKDPALKKNYNLKQVVKGKAFNKQWVAETFNLDPDKPLFSFIGRLVDEKGADLLPDICYQALNTYYDQLSLLMLGSGDPWVEYRLQEIKHFELKNYNQFIGYNEVLSHIIYAASDFILMPSRVEPCGLNQMYALRYGALPIVRRIGGLKDTIIDFADGGLGICHDQSSVGDVIHAIGRALELYQAEKNYINIQQKAMQVNHSWENAAVKYIELYKNLKSGV